MEFYLNVNNYNSDGTLDTAPECCTVPAGQWQSSVHNIFENEYVYLKNYFDQIFDDNKFQFKVVR